MSKVLIQFDGSNFYNKVKKILPRVHLTPYNYAGLARLIAGRKQNIEIKLGYLLVSYGSYHEKGVDVQIAVDITRGAIKNEYDKCFIISSDTDLLPAIQTAKDERKEVIYVGFENFVSQALSRNCSSSIVLKKSYVKKFAKKSR